MSAPRSVALLLNVIAEPASPEYGPPTLAVGDGFGVAVFAGIRFGVAVSVAVGDGVNVGGSVTVGIAV